MNLSIRAVAEQDIIGQVGCFVQQGTTPMARRFYAGVLDSIDAMLVMPEAGAPLMACHPALGGVRTWPVRGFDAFSVFYLVRPEALMVVRVLRRSEMAAA
jgi:plasmid stabilization system protein ParE